MTERRSGWLRSTCLTFVAIALTALAAGLHGRWTSRWTTIPNLNLAARTIQHLPESLGMWRAVPIGQSDSLSLRPVADNTCVHRAYQHQDTGQTVWVNFDVGLPEDIYVDRPESRLAHHTYIPNSRRRQTKPRFDDAPKESWWRATFPHHDASQPPLEVYYALSDGGPWKADPIAQVRHGGKMFLYQLTVAAEKNNVEDSDSVDSCEDFLTTFLPHIEPLLIVAPRASLPSRKELMSAAHFLGCQVTFDPTSPLCASQKSLPLRPRFAETADPSGSGSDTQARLATIRSIWSVHLSSGGTGIHR